MRTLPVSQVKARLSELIERAKQSGEPVVITQNGEGSAVLQDLESYEALRRSLAMLKLVAQGEKDAARGRVRPNRDVFRRLRARLGKR